MIPAPWERPPTGMAAAVAEGVAAAMPELSTLRLRLRAPRIDDFAAYAEIATTARGVHIGGPMSREDAWLDFAQMVAGWMLRGYGLWSVERLDDGALLGFVPLNHEFGDAEPELGFLFLAEAEGQGYAFEAAQAARAFAFDRLGWPSVVSYVAADNARSAGLARRLGARPDPTPAGAEIVVWRHVRQEAPA